MIRISLNEQKQFLKRVLNLKLHKPVKRLQFIKRSVSLNELIGKEIMRVILIVILLKANRCIQNFKSKILKNKVIKGKRRKHRLLFQRKEKFNLIKIFRKHSSISVIFAVKSLKMAKV